MPARIRHDDFSSGEEFLATSTRVVWKERLARGVSSELSGGATHVRRLDTADPDDDVVPQGRAELVARVSSSATTRVEQRSAVFVEAFLDPVRARYVPVGGAEEAIRLDLLPRWSLGAQLRLDAEEARVLGLLALGDHAVVVAATEEATARHPLRERGEGQHRPVEEAREPVVEAEERALEVLAPAVRRNEKDRPVVGPVAGPADHLGEEAARPAGARPRSCR